MFIFGFVGGADIGVVVVVVVRMAPWGGAGRVNLGLCYTCTGLYLGGVMDTIGIDDLDTISVFLTLAIFSLVLKLVPGLPKLA